MQLRPLKSKAASQGSPSLSTGQYVGKLVLQRNPGDIFHWGRGWGGSRETLTESVVPFRTRKEDGNSSLPFPLAVSWYRPILVRNLGLYISTSEWLLASARTCGRI